MVADDGDLVLLVKPQFEAGREVVSKGRGIVTDPQVWTDVLGAVASAIDARGATIMDAMASPITGTDGNVEFVVHVRPDSAVATVPSADEVAARLEQAVDQAASVEPGGLTWPRSGWCCTRPATRPATLAREVSAWLGGVRPRGAAADARRGAGRSPGPAASTSTGSPRGSIWP